MYYAACCCEDPAPPCECGENTYASMSWALADRVVPSHIFDSKCDIICQRNHYESFIDTRRRYTSGKVYMQCDTGSGVRYTSNALLPQFRKYDRDSLVILETEMRTRFRTFDVPQIYDCCEPPGLYCFEEPGGYYQVSSRNGSLLAFDPDDPDAAHTPNATIGITVTGSTRVDRGSYIVNQVPPEFRDRIDENRYYRMSVASCSWNLWMQIFETYEQTYFPPRSESDEYIEASAGGFGGSNFHKVTMVGDVGEECDPFAVGDSVVTYGVAIIADPFFGYELPHSSVDVTSTDSTCGPWTYFPQCCDSSEGRTFGPTNGNIVSTDILELDGGIFNLEFTDEQPPEAP